MKRKYDIAVVAKDGYARTVRMYVPKKADRAVIMHDGQNVFDDKDAAFGKSWRALDALKASGIKNTAIIGIDCAPTRLVDYVPFPAETEGYNTEPCGGGAGAYLDYIEHMVIPYLDKRFGFSMYAMLGSSAGALATLAYAARRDVRLRAYGMFSPPTFLSPKAYAEFFDTARLDGRAHYHVYCGGNESSGNPNKEIEKLIPQLYTDSAFSLVNGLRKCGALDIRLSFVNSGVHDETCWRAPMKLLFEDFASLKRK